MRKLLLKSLLTPTLTERAPRHDDPALAELAGRLDAAARGLLGRSLSIRQVDAGSCNGCELEIHALNNAFYDLERFGLKFVASPRHADVLFVTGPVTGNARSPYPSDSYSLLTVDKPGVLLWALKPQEDGIAKGVIARLWNVSDTALHCTLSLTPELAAAASATHIETDQERLPAVGNTITVSLARCQLQSLRLALSP